jgi:hypothetical protein
LLDGAVRSCDGDACGVFEFIHAYFGEPLSFLSASNRSGRDSRYHGKRYE